MSSGSARNPEAECPGKAFSPGTWLQHKSLDKTSIKNTDFKSPKGLINPTVSFHMSPPSRARGLTGESPDLKPGRELYWERKGGGWVLRPGLPPTLPPPQSQPRPLSWPLPFSSFGFFLMWGWISWRGRWPPRGGGHHRACGGWEGVYRPQHVGRGMLETARPPRWVWQESQPGAEGGTRVGEQGSSEQGDKARHPQGDQVRLGEPAGVYLIYMQSTS